MGGRIWGLSAASPTLDANSKISTLSLNDLTFSVPCVVTSFRSRGGPAVSSRNLSGVANMSRVAFPLAAWSLVLVAGLSGCGEPPAPKRTAGNEPAPAVAQSVSTRNMEVDEDEKLPADDQAVGEQKTKPAAALGHSITFEVNFANAEGRCSERHSDTLFEQNLPKCKPVNPRLQ